MTVIEEGSTKSHCVENTLWKRMWTSRKGGCMIMMMMDAKAYLMLG
jgi:hypothetical protein